MDRAHEISIPCFFSLGGGVIAVDNFHTMFPGIVFFVVGGGVHKMVVSSVYGISTLKQK